MLVALAILAIGLVTLYSAQSSGLGQVTEARFNTMAPMLAELKFAELRAGLLNDSLGEGDFGPDFPGYSWQLVAEPMAAQGEPWLREITPGMRRYTLSVTWAEVQWVHELVYYAAAD